MAKKKDTTALFEVISKARETQHQSGFTVPSWMGTDKQPDENVKDEPSPKSKPVISKPVMSTGEPMLSIAGGRLRISLNQKAGMVAAIGLIALLVIVFILGRVTAGGKADVDSKDAVTGTKNGSGTVKKYQPVAGKYYLLIQKMNSSSTLDKNEAAFVVDFLRKNSRLEAWVADFQGATAIFAAEEFENGNITSAVLNLASSFEKACAEYKRQYGTNYSFEQPRENRKMKPKLYSY